MNQANSCSSKTKLKLSSRTFLNQVGFYWIAGDIISLKKADCFISFKQSNLSGPDYAYKYMTVTC